MKVLETDNHNRIQMNIYQEGTNLNMTQVMVIN